MPKTKTACHKNDFSDLNTSRNSRRIEFRSSARFSRFLSRRSLFASISLRNVSVSSPMFFSGVRDSLYVNRLDLADFEHNNTKDDGLSPRLLFTSPRPTFTSPLSTFAPPRRTFAPPRSTFAPPRSTFAPRRSTFAPPLSTFAPPRSTFAPPCSTIAPPSSTFTSPRSIFVPHRSTFTSPRLLSPHSVATLDVDGLALYNLNMFGFMAEPATNGGLMSWRLATIGSILL